LIVRHVGDISPALLAQRGIRAVVSDLDNTLVEYRGEAIAEEVTAWLLALKEAGVGVCVASNTRRLGRLSRVAAAGGILHVPGNAGKPGTGGLRRALSLLGTAPEETAMVGDQVFTDIVAGNRLGLMTVLVNPLSPHEFIGTRLVSRPVERLVLRGPLRRIE
jgi:HAD superfamily phosphatase (TIGR01668 family)